MQLPKEIEDAIKKEAKEKGIDEEVFTRGVTYPLIPPRAKGSYTVTHWGWSRETPYPPIHTFITPTLVSSARHQIGDHQ